MIIEKKRENPLEINERIDSLEVQRLKIKAVKLIKRGNYKKAYQILTDLKRQKFKKNNSI